MDGTFENHFGIPEIFHTGGKPKDDHFEDEEFLYHRVNPTIDLLDDGEVNPAVFQILVNTSVVRQKYCQGREKEAARYDGEKGNHRLDWNVVQFQRGKLRGFNPQAGDGKNKNTYSLEPSHEPLPPLYPHSEIHTHRNGQHARSGIAPSLKTALKTFLAGISDEAINGTPDPSISG